MSAAATTTKAEQSSPPVSTLSIAVPGSILENAQSASLRSYLAGQIARAACIFKVDEVIVFDDLGVDGLSDRRRRKANNDTDTDPETAESSSSIRSSCLQLARILQYLECPQYLRKFFFPLHTDLQYSGLLNPLDAPHHLRQHNDFIYREGVVTNKPAKQDKGSYVNIGLLNDCLVDKVLTPGIRVTVKLRPNQGKLISNGVCRNWAVAFICRTSIWCFISELKSRKIKASVVSPSQPRDETGVYWGYSVRIAKSLSDIFTKSPYATGYDMTIGTSDKGDNVHDLGKASLPYNHALIVYGGLQGLETALENEDELEVTDPSLLFDRYLNTVPGQGITIL